MTNYRIFKSSGIENEMAKLITLSEEREKSMAKMVVKLRLSRGRAEGWN